MKMGKHVYVQKPLTHSIYERRGCCASWRPKPKWPRKWANQGSAADGLRRGVGK